MNWFTQWLLKALLSSKLDQLVEGVWGKFIPLFGAVGKKFGVVAVLRGDDPGIPLRRSVLILTPSVKGIALDIFGGYLTYEEYRQLEREGLVIKF